MRESSRVVSDLNLKDVHPLSVTGQGMTELYFDWKDLISGCNPLPSAALFISNFINSNTTLVHLVKVIENFIRAGHADDPAKEAQKASIWLHIHITQSNKKFEEPRWHQDDPYMKFDPGREHDVR